MSNAKLFLISLFAAALLTVQAADAKDNNPDNVEFYELKRENLRVNFTNLGARIVSLNVSDKSGYVGDIVLGYDTVDAYQEDKYFLGAIVGSLASGNFTLDESDGTNNTLNGDQLGLGNVIWKVKKYKKSEENPSITFHYNSSDNEQGIPLDITATYLLQDKNKLKLTLYTEAKDEETTPVNLALNAYWNLGGHNSSKNVLHHQLRVFASNYTDPDQDGRIRPVRDTPYDFQNLHSIQSKFKELEHGYEVNYVLDDRENEQERDNVTLAAVLRDNESGRVLKVWTDQPVLHFSTADELKNVKGKGGIVYKRNAGVLLAAQGYHDSENITEFLSPIITKEKPFEQTTVFEFLVKK